MIMEILGQMGKLQMLYKDFGKKESSKIKENTARDNLKHGWNCKGDYEKTENFDKIQWRLWEDVLDYLNFYNYKLNLS